MKFLAACVGNPQPMNVSVFQEGANKAASQLENRLKAFFSHVPSFPSTQWWVRLACLSVKGNRQFSLTTKRFAGLLAADRE